MDREEIIKKLEWIKSCGDDNLIILEEIDNLILNLNHQMNHEGQFRKENTDCYVPEDFSQVHREYANLPEYLRRWCVFKGKEQGRKDDCDL